MRIKIVDGCEAFNTVSGSMVNGVCIHTCVQMNERTVNKLGMQYIMMGLAYLAF